MVACSLEVKGVDPVLPLSYGGLELDATDVQDDLASRVTLLAAFGPLAPGLLADRSHGVLRRLDPCHKHAGAMLNEERQPGGPLCIVRERRLRWSLDSTGTIHAMRFKADGNRGIHAVCGMRLKFVCRMLWSQGKVYSHATSNSIRRM